MNYKIYIFGQHQHRLDLDSKAEEAFKLYQEIVDGLADAKRNGKFYSYPHSEHPFTCNPEHIQSVVILKVENGQENKASQEGNGQEAQQACCS